jgi:hypothetical protein
MYIYIFIYLFIDIYHMYTYIYYIILYLFMYFVRWFQPRDLDGTSRVQKPSGRLSQGAQFLVKGQESVG